MSSPKGWAGGAPDIGGNGPYPWGCCGAAGRSAGYGAGCGIGRSTAASAVRAEFRTAARPLITQAIDRSRLVATKGAVHREVATAQDLGVRDSSAAMERIHLVLQRPRERQAAFDAEVEALHQPGNPSYHQWLTPEAIGAEFGPSAADIAALTGFLTAEGFTVNRVGKSGMYVDFSGTVAQVQQTFHTEIHNLRLGTGEQHFSAVREAELPEALAPLVAGFLSLNDIPPHPSMVAARPAVQASSRHRRAGECAARQYDVQRQLRCRRAGLLHHLQRKPAAEHRDQRLGSDGRAAGRDGHPHLGRDELPHDVRGIAGHAQSDGRARLGSGDLLQSRDHQ